MKTIVFFLGVLVLFPTSSLKVYSLDVPLKYEKTSPRGMYPFGYGLGRFSTIKPEGNWSMPALNSSRPLYALIKLADSSHLIVLDAVKPGDQYLSRMYIDSDGDRDLVEEKPLDGSAQKSRNGTTIGRVFPPIEFSILTNGVRTPYRLQINNRMPPMNINSKTAASITFMYEAACGYRGDFTLGGTAFTIYLGDTNGNGRFNDYVDVAESSHTPFHSKGDHVLLTDGKYRDQYDNQPLGDLLWLNDALYKVRIDIPKGSMTLARIEGGLAPVKLPMRIERLSLYGESKKGSGHCLMVYKPSSGVLMLPLGEYRLLSYEAYRRDEKGDLWRMNAAGTDDSPVVSVSSPGGAVLVYGEPYIPMVGLIRDFWVVRGNLSLNFTVEGAGKERMLALTTIESSGSGFIFSGIGKSPAAPAYTIVKADGELVAKGKFEYG